jgi:hypothetical protein
VLADSSKWLPAALARHWRVRDEPADEIVHPRLPNVHVHNWYFGTSGLGLVTGVVWEGGVARPGEMRRRIARLPVSETLVNLLAKSR